jgi:hypothetical protein
MRIHNLFVDSDGETHFRDIEVEWVKEGPAGQMSATLPATGIIFRKTPGTYDFDWHPAPRRQYIIPHSPYGCGLYLVRSSVNLVESVS